MNFTRDRGASGLQNPPMRSFSICSLIGGFWLFAGGMAMAQVSQSGPPAVPPAELSDADFDSLVEKSNLYVKAINALGQGEVVV